MSDQTKPISMADALAEERRVIGAREDEPLSALCISGGGIRSATFGLGALQGLADLGLLGRFHYLSTVSGGGYIGSWLRAWVCRADGIDNVIPHLRANARRAEPGQPDPIQHLRAYNQYLSPNAGLLSGDVWSLVATVVRNIVLNWLVMIPLLMAVLIVPRLYLSILTYPILTVGGRRAFLGEPGIKDGCPDFGNSVLNVIGESWVITYAVPALAMALFAASLFNTLRYMPGIGGLPDRGKLHYCRYVLAPLVGSVLLYLTYDSLYYLGDQYVAFNSALQVVVWVGIPCVIAGLLFVAIHPLPFRQRLRVLFGRLPLSLLAMAGGTGVATWITTNFVLWNPDCTLTLNWSSYVTLGPALILLGYCLGTTLFIGLSSHFTQDEDQEWMSRAVAGVMVFSVIWLAVCWAVLVLPEWVMHWRAWGTSIMGAVGGLSAWASTLRPHAVTNANTGPNMRDRIVGIVGKLAPAVFIALLVVGLSISTTLLMSVVFSSRDFYKVLHIQWHTHNDILLTSNPLLLIAVAFGLAAISWLTARVIDINRFSLNGMYRDRLVRAYLGASNADRKPQAFTGFSNTDDIALHELKPALRPFPVVNTTLNLVGGDNLAWQERKAMSFTMTPLTCGAGDLGYRPTQEYGNGITLGSAVAISGAAASPNMGYHSSPVIGFIMTLFNARLGAWLGNPAIDKDHIWKAAGPTNAMGMLAREALGLTSDKQDYVYLSDGGHFENLAVYEMVRRRCRLIVVLDSGCDPDFNYDDLGNALRKIAIDLRVPIEFDAAGMKALRAHDQRHAVATIRYSLLAGGGEDGRLIYIKPMLLGNEPPDIMSYAASNRSFPHQTTNDQWFNEDQTESYRRLGLFTLMEISQGWTGATLTDWCTHLSDTAKRTEA